MAPTLVDDRTDSAYFEALGRFAHEFAMVEVVIFYTLAFYARIPPERAKAVFSGVRVRQAIDFINRLCEIKTPGQHNLDDLVNVFKQLRAINTLRDDIIHYGSFIDYDKKERITTNAIRALTEERIKYRSASTETLNKAAADLHKIRMHLVMHRIQPLSDLEWRAKSMPAINDAWQYIPE